MPPPKHHAITLITYSVCTSIFTLAIGYIGLKIQKRKKKCKQINLPHAGETKANIEALGIVIPKSPSPKGNYVSIIGSGAVGNEKMLYLCGHIPTNDDGSLIVGKLGKDLEVDDGYKSARACAINILGTLTEYLNANTEGIDGLDVLDRVQRIVKVVGFVNCTDDFTQQPRVINGASDLFANVFGGKRGRHARSAVGTNSLPLNIATEVECIVELY